MPLAATQLEEIDATVAYNAPLAPLTWYKLGGPAEALVRPHSFEALGELVRRCRAESLPMHVLGSGANLLVPDEGVQGVVVKLDHEAFARYQPSDDGRLRVGAGFDLFQLVRQTAKEGRSGLQHVAGIPASVGGAIRMNAGGAFGEIGAAVAALTLMDDTGEVFTRSREDLNFSYRSSNLTAPFILDATFELEPDDPAELMHRVKDIFVFKKTSQPMGDKSCGCVFKNHDHGPAGKLIDQAGLKGRRVGGASVSDVHANFIVVEPGKTTAADVRQLIAEVQDEVEQQHGVRLKRELVVW